MNEKRSGGHDREAQTYLPELVKREQTQWPREVELLLEGQAPGVIEPTEVDVTERDEEVRRVGEGSQRCNDLALIPWPFDAK